ncbi:MAG: 50S ribosomal protein L21 [Bacteroidetes bacterium]|nr:50S ribosomal protein L21 [Bacteroidota bacterium]
MYAIVEIAGQQFKVTKDQKVFVHRLAEEAGAKVTFDDVLLLDQEGAVTVGAPAIEGASVEAQVLKHLKGDKVIVFKKKRRKGYKVKNGHRQALTELLIENILVSGAKKSKPAEKETAKPVATKETAKPAPKNETDAPKKKATADDLRKVEGIGPKIASILQENGIDSFKALSKTSVEKLSEILTAAGGTYASKKPDTWPQQAALAAAGDWDALKTLQDELNGGIKK